jgi:hypothetical protein
MKPTLVYDATCALCTNYQRFLERRLGDRLDYEPAGAEAKDVKYKAADGATFSGTKAIEKLTADFPEVRELNFFLPQKLRDAGVSIPGKLPVAGVKAAYKVSGAVRKTYHAVRGGCNCGGGPRKSK